MTELPPGHLLRRPRAEDAQAIVDLLVACDIADAGEPDTTLEDVTAEWAHPRFDLSRDAWIVTAPDASVAAYGWVWARIAGTDLQGDVAVHPQLRGIGFEPLLLDLIEERGREHRSGAEAPVVHFFAMPGSVLANLLVSRGYAHTRTFLRMTIDLREGFPEAPALEGVDLRLFRKGIDEEAVHQAVAEAFQDHFRFAPESHEEWVSRRVERPDFDPNLWLVAWDGSEVAGAVLSYQFGDLGWIRELGVRAGWRGRGIGRALLLGSFRLFQARKQDRVALGVDSENATGATRLYEQVGMKETERHDLFQRRLESL